MQRRIASSIAPGAVAGATVMLAAGGALAAGSDPRGVWLNDSGRGAVEIRDCGAKLCGHVVWTRDASDTKGCGRQIIGEASPSGSGTWGGGWIYSPERKRKFDVELKPLGDGTLRVTGFAGTKLFSKTMVWTPAPANLERCSEGSAVEANAEEPTPPAETAAGKPATAARAEPATASEASSSGRQPPAATDKAAAAKPAPAPQAAKKTALKPSKDELAEERAAAAPAEGRQQTADASGADDEAGDKTLSLDTLKNMKFGDSDYGLHETGNGKCRLKVPYVTLTVKCPN